MNSNIEMIKKIDALKKENQILILAHVYQPLEIQDIADYIGDSLALSKIAKRMSQRSLFFVGWIRLCS